MKHLILTAVLAALVLSTGPVLGQTTKSKTTTKKTTKVTTKSNVTMSKSNAGSENSAMEAAGDNPVHSETTDDRLYLNHPYFNGEPRWTHVDSLYTHGDFPWALVSKNPDNFRFNPQSGQWEMLQPPSMGKTTPTR